MVTVTSDKMHLSNMLCPELLKVEKRIIAYEGRKDFWVQKIAGVYSVLLLFSMSLFAAAVKVEQNRSISIIV